MDRFGETFREAVRAIEVMRERGREEIEQLKRELDGALRREGEARERGDRVRAYNVLRGHDEAGDAKLDAAPREAAERCSARAAERAAGRIARILRADGGESFRPMIASVIVDEIRRMYEPEGTPSEEQAEEAATGPRDGSAAFVAMPTTEVEDRWIVGNRDLERLYGVADLTDAQKAIIREIARCGALHPFMQHRGVTMTCTLGNRHEGPHVFEPEDGGAFTAWRREVAP